jgi:hydroxymethylglutaryl-CoA reductase
MSRKAELSVESAERMIENVIATYSLPIGLAQHLLVNGIGVVVPMVVEEPSIVAALSSAAKLSRASGGVVSTQEGCVLVGQIQLVDLRDVEHAAAILSEHRDRVVAMANQFIPKMVARGGGVRGVEIRPIPEGKMVLVQLLVDTCDAMGANVVNRLCETIADTVANLTGGRPVLRILSNLTDRCLVTARVRIAINELHKDSETSRIIASNIVVASQCAELDPYRAATHNKGIFNGIDAVAIATGNDWRAIEAGGHAFAGMGDGYKPLAVWRMFDGELHGFLCMPLKVSVVGAQIKAHPTVRIAHEILNFPSARRLAEVMGAVGLLQNFAALRALCSDGICRGHLRLHARCEELARHSQGGEL